MCFVNDCEWNASVHDEYDIVAEKETRCDECGRKFPTGTTMLHIHQQEYEECHACDQGDCECPRDADDCCDGCKCDEPSFGEDFDYDRCQDCSRFLEAVKAAEIEAGCDDSEALPSMPNMLEDISNGGRSEAKKYWRKAMQMFPEMREYLAWLWQKAF